MVIGELHSGVFTNVMRHFLSHANTHSERERERESSSNITNRITGFGVSSGHLKFGVTIICTTHIYINFLPLDNYKEEYHTTDKTGKKIE